MVISLKLTSKIQKGTIDKTEKYGVVALSKYLYVYVATEVGVNTCTLCEEKSMKILCLHSLKTVFLPLCFLYFNKLRSFTSMTNHQ